MAVQPSRMAFRSSTYDPYKTSAQAGARGGNESYLDGSVHWLNINKMTNYSAFPGGSAYMNAW